MASFLKDLPSKNDLAFAKHIPSNTHSLDFSGMQHMDTRDQADEPVQIVCPEPTKFLLERLHLRHDREYLEAEQQKRGMQAEQRKRKLNQIPIKVRLPKTTLLPTRRPIEN